MALEARVKQDNPWPMVQAFAGQELVKGEWRPVPEGREEEARRHTMLDIREAVVVKRPPGVPHTSPQTVGSAQAQPDGGGGSEPEVPEVQAAIEAAGIRGADKIAGLLAGAGTETVSVARGMELEDLTAIKGIGKATAVKIMAAVGAEVEE